jgi:hypothetical protein
MMTKIDIVKQINSLKDDHTYIDKSIDLLYNVQSSRGPLVEVVTIIKYEKPTLYSVLKTRFDHKPAFKMLFDVAFDYDVAKKSLGL